MPSSDPSYHQRRYKEDAGFRAAVVAATMRWQERQREADPDAFADRVARGIARRRERYQSDPEFRERLLEAQRLRRMHSRAECIRGANASGASRASPADPE
jgi:hypothetical protein